MLLRRALGLLLRLLLRDLLNLQLLVDNVLCLLRHHTRLDQVSCLRGGLQLHLLLLLLDLLLLLHLLLLNVLLQDVLLLLLLRGSGIHDSIVVWMNGGGLAHNQLLVLRSLDQNRLLLDNDVCVVQHLRGGKYFGF